MSGRSARSLLADEAVQTMSCGIDVAHKGCLIIIIFKPTSTKPQSGKLG